MTSVLPKPAATSPGHGAAFTRHLYSLKYSPSLGWHGGELQPMEKLSLHPATLGLHYGQVIFEGMKAFRQQDGSVAVFRPWENARRFNRSAARLAMPDLPEHLYVDGVDRLVAADHGELSDDPDHSLYLRPLMFGTDANLMLRPSEEYLFLVMAFVAGGFFGDVVRPVSVLVSRDQARAMPGGTGDVKCAANYGPSFVAQRKAQEAGCQQVVWLDQAERRWVEEMGGMNLFFVRGDEVATTPLTGTLLPGVTRDSLLRMAARLGYRVAERPVSVDEWRAGCASGEITEVFACGTAAVVTPVGRVRDVDGDFTVGDGEMGPVTKTLRTALVDLQHGRTPDVDNWLHRVC
ncbi:branched-chain amino acid aminotransferase [Saccharothrix mutabilis subsp. mutabilis]|uniref:Branched-chain-amino-acid aminotransferase n=1 Tax=Saccharothrix mutabilis subsp. mutabilis TaxID=66855 RepID=A0ABP3EC07_9PSEU